MFLAKLSEGYIFKRIIESIKDLVDDVNIDLTPTGMSLQAIDHSHVALVSLKLSTDGFESYTCHKPMTIGLNLPNLYKIMKLGDNDDSLTLKVEDEPSFLTILYENQKRGKSAEFNLSLISFDNDNLNISDNNSTSGFIMSSNEFYKLMKELYQISESVTIEASDELIKFSVKGNWGSGCVKIVPTDSENREEQVQIKFEEPVNLDFFAKIRNNVHKGKQLKQHGTSKAE